MDICKLTKKPGKYVKSHIIPKSLTKPNLPGNQFIQKNLSSRGPEYIKRNDSWYDKGIVTREGEDILAELDSFAIQELREHGLLWSSKKHRATVTGAINDVVVVEFSDSKQMRKYFLSLLWRSVVSELPEFKQISLSDDKTERLRRIIIGDEEDRRDIFPTTLVQIATKGASHNLGPIRQTIHFESVGTQDIFRFYMDGLIAHMYINPTLAIIKEPFPFEHPMFLGEKNTIVTQVSYESSFQLHNMKKHTAEYLRKTNERS